MLQLAFVAEAKKTGTVECECHTTIRLISQLTNIILSVIVPRSGKSIRQNISKEQFGFIEVKITRNTTFSIGMVMEKAVKAQENLFLCYIIL